MTREDKVKENWELITAEISTSDERALESIISAHCPSDSIFEEIFSDAECGECLCFLPENKDLSTRACCEKHWKGEI